MKVLMCAFALLAGVVGAGFASGREIARFFAGHGAACGAAVVVAVCAMSFFFLRLSAKMEKNGASGANQLCQIRFGRRLGALCSTLFYLLCAVTAGAMLAACAELTALTLPIRPAYGIGLGGSLAAALFLARRDAGGLAVTGVAVTAALPVLLVRLLFLPSGEADFLPAMMPDFPVRAVTDGVIYAALNAAMLFGAVPVLLELKPSARRRAVLFFAVFFALLLLLGCAVCLRHLPVVLVHPMPFVELSRGLGGGYVLVALCLYAAALSTLCAMLLSMMRMVRVSPGFGTLLAAASSLLFAQMGFTAIVESAYPVLGAVCAGLLLLLCT